MFFSIPEDEGKSCSEELTGFFKEQLNIETPFELMNTKRIGHAKSCGSRPLLTSFVSPRDRLLVWRKRFSITKPFGIGADYPPEVRYARSSLVPKLKELKSQGKHTGILFPAILMCNGKVVERVDIAEVFLR